MMRATLVVITTIAAASFGFVQRAVADAALERRFHAEASIGWEKLHDFSLRLRGTVVDEATPVSGLPESGKVRSVHTFDFNGDDRLYLWNVRTEREEFEKAYGVNADYGFQLERKGREGSWQLRELGDRGQTDQKIARIGIPVFVAYSLEYQTLPWTVAQPGFRIKSMDAVKRDGEELVALNFTTSAFVRPDYRVVSGRVLLDPARYWAVREYEIKVQMDVPATSTGSIEYAERDLDGFPIPSRYTQEFKATDQEGPIHRRRDCEYEGWAISDLGAADARLPHFGLPEPARPDQGGGVPPGAWMVALAVAFAAAAVWLRRGGRWRA